MHDTLTVKSFDGTATKIIDVTITGTNDATTIGGVATASLAETNAVLSTKRTTTATDGTA